MSSDKEISIKLLNLLGYDPSLYDDPKVQYIIYQFLGKLANASVNSGCKHLKTYEQKKHDGRSEVIAVFTLCVDCHKELSKKIYKSENEAMM